MKGRSGGGGGWAAPADPPHTPRRLYPLSPHSISRHLTRGLYKPPPSGAGGPRGGGAPPLRQWVLGHSSGDQRNGRRSKTSAMPFIHVEGFINI